MSTIEEKLTGLEKDLKDVKEQLHVVKGYYLGYSKGGSSRQITARYNDMKEALKTILVIGKENPDFIKGYEYAIAIFERKDIKT